jgi:glycerol-1-phosphate dehydrogenase [NAD(P)+]
MVQAEMKRDTTVLSVGSGTVTDTAKHACHAFEQTSGHRPVYVAYPTANSMGAYTSNTATVYVHGVKRSLPSRLPDALVYDLQTLRDAPYPMTVAGAGDMLASLVSLSDWYIAHRLGLDTSYSEFQHTLMGTMEQVFVEHAALIREGNLEGVSLQARFMAASGIGVSLQGTSTPLSGYEHVISHLIDQQAEFAGRATASHGLQVALATLLVSDAYGYFLNRFKPTDVDPESCYPALNTMKRLIHRTFAGMDPSGDAAAECWTEYSMKLEAWHANRQAFEHLLRDWDSIRNRIEKPLRPPEWIAAVLSNLGSPLAFEELDPPVTEDCVQFAFINAPLIRRRLTLGDLFVFLNWDREAVWKHVWQDIERLAGKRQ